MISISTDVFLKIYIVFVHLTLLHKYKQGTSLDPAAASVGLKVLGHHNCIRKPQVRLCMKSDMHHISTYHFQNLHNKKIV